MPFGGTAQEDDADHSNNQSDRAYRKSPRAADIFSKRMLDVVHGVRQTVIDRGWTPIRAILVTHVDDRHDRENTGTQDEEAT